MSKSFSTRRPIVLSALLFIFLLCVGFHIAKTKFLWTDEIYTQLSSIDHKTFDQILRGTIEEGNNNPLFYILQKSVINIFQYKAPSHWTGLAKVYDPKSQIILRFVAIVVMAVGLCFVFYYFSTRYSLFAGSLALVLFLTSGPIWSYWAEARPYGLWISLAIIQLLSFREVYLTKNQRWSWVLFCSNLLMSLTILFGIFQILATSFLIAYREKSLKRFIALSGLPLLLTAYYYVSAPHYAFYFDKNPLELVFSLVSPNYLIVFVIYVVFLWMAKNKYGREKFWLWPLFAMVGVALALIGMLLYISRPAETSFAISNRYFIFLVPIFLIATASFLIELFQYVSKEKVWLLPYSVLVICFLVLLIVSQPDFVFRILTFYLS
jgi:hypothetical protein